MTKKFEFVPGDEITIAPGRKVKRIRALVDIPSKDVLAGDLGGYIENESNLDASGGAWVAEEARVSRYARVYDEAYITGAAWVEGEAQVFGEARVSGSVCVSGDSRLSGDSHVFGEADVGLLKALQGMVDLYDTDEGCRSLPQYVAARAALEKAKGGVA